MFGARPNSQFDAFTQFHVPEAAFDQLFVVNAAWAIGPKAIPNSRTISVAENLDFMGVILPALAGRKAPPNRQSTAVMLVLSCPATASNRGEKETVSHAMCFSARI